MEKKHKIYLGVAAVLGGVGVCYLLKDKSNYALTDTDAQLKKALDRFGDASPVGVTGAAPTKADLAKGYVYLQKTLTDKQKHMFIDYSNSFMDGLEKYAVSPEALKDDELAGLITVMNDTESLLEKKYGTQDTTNFMQFMNSFDPKKLK